MLLKLTALMAMLFLSDAGGGAADTGEGGEGAGTEAGDTGTQGGDGAATETRPSTNSINRQIKDFAAQRGITVEDLLTQFTELENAGKTETQRLMDQINDYKSKYESAVEQNRSIVARSAIADAAKDAGAYDPDAIYELAKSGIELDDETSLEIEINDKGKVTNAQAVIAAMKSKRPGLFKPATGTSDAGRQGDSAGGKGDINALFRQLAERNR